MDGYNFATNGWVDKLQVIPIFSALKNQFLVRARVRHSQRLSATPLKPWVAVEDLGTVICAHCNCMAGLGEACSHMEMNTQVKKNMSCTSVPCAWLPPSFQSVPLAPISEIDFTTTQKRVSSKTQPINSPKEADPEDKQKLNPSEAELQKFY